MNSARKEGITNVEGRDTVEALGKADQTVKLHAPKESEYK